MGENTQPIYVDLASETDDPHVTEIESLCLACHNMGTTRLLMTKIPHFREVILTSFECDKCGNKNTGFQPGQIQDRGVHYELSVQCEKELSRQVVKSDHATVSIPELQLEIPANVDKGEVTTVEGLLRRTVDGLNQDQAARREENPEIAEQIDDFITQVHGLLTVNRHFTVIVDDPTGNSFVENPEAPQVDPKLKRKTYKRSSEQDSELGFQEPESEENKLSPAAEEGKKAPEGGKGEDLTEEVMVFNTVCDKCSRPTTTNMKLIRIPYFKEVIIMATHCEACGNRTNEVKSGSGISEKGKKIMLRLTDPYDMARDLLKSESCNLRIPELDLDIGGGLLGGKFTTLEGLLVNIREDLVANPFLMGDSAEDGRKEVVRKLLDNLQQVIDGNLQVTFIMDDPAGNSYLQNIYAPDDDPELKVEEYERTFEQNEELGLNDMKTENYTDSSTATDSEITS